MESFSRCIANCIKTEQYLRRGDVASMGITTPKVGISLSCLDESKTKHIILTDYRAKREMVRLLEKYPNGIDDFKE